MSDVLRWAMRQHVGDPRTKLTLLALASYADQEGRCWPGQEQLAADTEQSSRQVRRQLAYLGALGVVSSAPRYVPGANRTSNLYTLHLGSSVNIRPDDERPRGLLSGRPKKAKDGVGRGHKGPQGNGPPVSPTLRTTATGVEDSTDGGRGQYVQGLRTPGGRGTTSRTTSRTASRTTRREKPQPQETETVIKEETTGPLLTHWLAGMKIAVRDYGAQPVGAPNRSRFQGMLRKVKSNFDLDNAEVMTLMDHYLARPQDWSKHTLPAYDFASSETIYRLREQLGSEIVESSETDTTQWLSHQRFWGEKQ